MFGFKKRDHRADSLAKAPQGLAGSLAQTMTGMEREELRKLTFRLNAIEHHLGIMTVRVPEHFSVVERPKGGVPGGVTGVANSPH